MSVAIIGAGVAGTAAAFAVAQAGVRPRVFHAAAGSSALYSGALDFDAWDEPGPNSALGAELEAFSAALEAWQLWSEPRPIATVEGGVRKGRGCDRALLDLSLCAGRRIAVVDVERDDWDAPLLSRSLAGSVWTRQTGTRFEAVPIDALRDGSERRISAYDFASLLDDPERRAAWLDLLQKCVEKPDAWLFGPWLGLAVPVAAEFAAALGVPVGETTSAVGGVAGARFESARDRLLAQCADVERVRVTRIERCADGYRVHTGAGPGREFRALVLATGGVAAGGVELERSFERRGGAGFHLPFEAPVALALDGEVTEGVSSLAQIDFASRGLGSLLRVGIAANAEGEALACPGLFVAGDALAGRPRAALEAARAGIAAAKLAVSWGK